MRQLSRVFLLGTIVMMVGLAYFYFTGFDRVPNPTKQFQIPAKYAKSFPGPDLRPNEWALTQRTFPHWQADGDAYSSMIAEARAIRAQKRDFREVEWEFAGPTNIGGRISDLAINPVDSDLVYAGGATGGVFKSTDGGWNWFPVFDDQAVLPIGDIALDPVNPDVVYVGTGEPNGGHNNFSGGGVYKSTDGGTSWTLLGLENTHAIGRIVVDPVNTDNVFVAAVGAYFAPPTPDRGVYRSTNGGLDWEQSLFVSDSTGAIDIVINPENPAILYVAMWERIRRPDHGTHINGPTSGIYKSTDSGDSWHELGAFNGLPGDDEIGRIGLAISPSNPDILYALYNDGTYVTGLYKTTNAGQTWFQVDPTNQMNDGVASFSWYFGNVRVHPANPDKVFVLDVALMASDDGGQTWPRIYGYDYMYFYNLHVDHHALEFFPDNPNKIINGNDGGLNISTDGGISWTKIESLPVTQFYEIAIDYTNPQRLYGGTQDNGTMRTLTGAVDDWQQIYGGDGFYTLVDYTNPNIIFAEYQWGGLGKSTDGGYSFSGATDGIDASEPTNWSTPVVMDPVNPSVLYYGTNRLYQTIDGAEWWNPISPILAPSTGGRLGTITTIDVAPSDPNVIYVGCDNSAVWVTADGGANWSDVSADLPYRWVTRIAVDPTNPDIAYVTFSGLKWGSPEPHVFRTADRGLSWSDISAGLPNGPLNVVRVDPLYPHFIYVGSDVGCFFSHNSGQTWAALGTGMPIVSVYDIKIHPLDYFLVAGTHGRSMYKINLWDVLLSIEDDDELAALDQPRLLPNYPNPFNPSTTFPFFLPQGERVAMKIFDASGRLVRDLADGRFSAGRHDIRWDGNNNMGQPVSSGQYVYQLQIGKDVQNRTCVLLK